LGELLLSGGEFFREVEDDEALHPRSRLLVGCGEKSAGKVNRSGGGAYLMRIAITMEMFFGPVGLELLY
jgi:hypothetical protein